MNRKTGAVSQVLLLLALVGCSSGEQSADLRNEGAMLTGDAARVRKPYTPIPDNPLTSNNESNDQPLVGHYGSETMTVESQESGNTYTLDVDREGDTVNRVYFPRGGWIDFPDCELDSDGSGDCEDQQGRQWSFEGEGTGAADSTVDEEREDEDENDDEATSPDGDDDSQDE